MELNEALALELLTALEQVPVKMGQREFPLSRETWPGTGVPGVDDFVGKSPGFHPDWMEKKQDGISRFSPVSLAEQGRKSGKYGEMTQVEIGGDTYSVFTKNTTQIVTHNDPIQRAELDAQTVSRAFQRDARRYAP